MDQNSPLVALFLSATKKVSSERSAPMRYRQPRCPRLLHPRPVVMKRRNPHRMSRSSRLYFLLKHLNKASNSSMWIEFSCSFLLSKYALIFAKGRERKNINWKGEAYGVVMPSNIPRFCCIGRRLVHSCRFARSFFSFALLFLPHQRHRGKKTQQRTTPKKNVFFY